MFFQQIFLLFAWIFGLGLNYVLGNWVLSGILVLHMEDCWRIWVSVYGFLAFCTCMLVLSLDLRVFTLAYCSWAWIFGFWNGFVGLIIYTYLWIIKILRVLISANFFFEHWCLHVMDFQIVEVYGVESLKLLRLLENGLEADWICMLILMWDHSLKWTFLWLNC